MWLYLVCFFLFPIICVVGVKKENGNENEWLSKNRTDSIRGIAISCIMLHHVASRTIESAPYTFPFVQMGFAGVAVFFLLSGYAHFIVYGEKELSVQFLWDKCKRMLVPYFIIYLFYIIMLIVCRNTIDFQKIILDILQLRLPGTLCWYFKIQILLYLIFFLCFGVLFKKCRKSVKIFTTTISVLIYIGIAIALKLEPYWYFTVIYFPAGLLLGYFRKSIYSVVKKYNILFIGFNIIIFCSLQMFVFFKGFSNSYYQIHFLLTLSFVLICVLLILHLEFNSPLLKLFGKISLELYLVHGMLLEADIFRGWEFNKGRDVLVYFVLSFLMSWLVHIVSVKITLKL